jgi:hypothetical protein
LPIHAEAVGDRSEPGLQCRQIDREIGGVEHHPHEEVAGLDVIELLGIENVLPVMGEKRRHRGYDAGAIRTGQCQHKLMVGHGLLVAICKEYWGGNEDSGPALSPPAPLRQSPPRRQDEQTTDDLR